MTYKTQRIGDICEVITKGTTPTSIGFDYSTTGVPFLRVQNIIEGGVFYSNDVLHVGSDVHRALKRSTIFPGDLLVTIAGTIGRVGVVPNSAPEMNCNQAVAIVRLKGGVSRSYVRHWFETEAARKQIRGGSVKGTIANLSLSQVAALEIALPSLEKQEQIAAILDQAESLRTKRRAALDKLDTLAQAIFIEMFGDPALNPKGWPMRELGDLARKFSDGPFGSNLKSSHYVESGVRVVRLQNIGSGEFVDKDRAYISEEHFSRLKKHECLPGDVLIGTLGEPNLRACIQPEWLSVALNKADCVQFRSTVGLVTSEYICALLNNPSTERMAQDLMLGQTRVRISMGRLKTLKVPVPPYELQSKFTQRVRSLEDVRLAIEKQADELDALFASLQHRAFRGEL